MKAEGKTTNGKWPDVTFGEIFEISSSKRVLEAQWKTAGVPFYRAREIVKLAKVGTVENELFISEELYREYQTRYGVPRPGDLMISAVGTLGACYVVQPNDRFYYKDASVLRFSPKQPVCSRFIQHAFGTNHILDQVHAGSGSTVGTYTISRANQTRIPLPPLAEQRRIAEVLDRAEALRAKRRAALAQLDALTQSLFLDLFGDPVPNPKKWPRVEFRDLLANIDSGWSPVCLDRPVEGAEWGVLKLGAVTRCEYNASENKALPLGVEPDPSIEVKPGDLLFARKNTHELVAACALVRETPPRLMMSDLVFRFRLRADAKIDTIFLHQLLISPTKRSEIQKLAGGSAGSMPNISKARLLATVIEVPPLPLQREFARRVTAVEKLKTAQRASLAELDALFATLQHRAFRGEL